jgi:hypothetical protein
MDILELKGCCDECKDNKFPRDRLQIGKKIENTKAVGKGYDKTEYSFYQCQKCGSVWQVLIDTGAGGYGEYKKRLTDNF